MRAAQNMAVSSGKLLPPFLANAFQNRQHLGDVQAFSLLKNPRQHRCAIHVHPPLPSPPWWSSNYNEGVSAGCSSNFLVSSLNTNKENITSKSMFQPFAPFVITDTIMSFETRMTCLLSP
eukprot:TRINITY_DN2262_c1_g1_i1.p1 TRINITY_DN2262_c1_g1~~TRINITY_DN2262_c1_g1_i1.p1  ORF type:complete len:120 (+),score=5.64 TRINITY_DN2262_c1_g1_i1:103-462(+)